uniref:Uncharacterized protein n=1 Tax=Anguilla anguilla TaxID=7936 RepID=A0A0E9TLM3_ANGAN
MKTIIPTTANYTTNHSFTTASKTGKSSGTQCLLCV